MIRNLLLAAAFFAAAPAFAQAPAMKPAPATTHIHPAKAAETHRVDVNSATLEQLTAIPGVTRADAEAIVKGRPFKSLSQLESGKILSPGVFADVKDRLSVGR